MHAKVQQVCRYITMLLNLFALTHCPQEWKRVKSNTPRHVLTSHDGLGLCNSILKEDLAFTKGLH